MHLFRNDYSEGAAPQVMDAIAAISGEQNVGYTEGDAHCEHARELIRQACGCPDAMVEFCIGGTSANVICLNGMLRDWEGVICTPDAVMGTELMPYTCWRFLMYFVSSSNVDFVKPAHFMSSFLSDFLIVARMVFLPTVVMLHLSKP